MKITKENHLPTINQLEYMLSVEKEKHFGRAASECHISQPSLSAQIQKLEEELGVIIFDRSKKPIMVTEVGMAIIDQARFVLKEHRKITDLASQGAKTPQGEFNLAVIPTLAPYLIPLFVGEFSKKYPKVKLKINEYKTEDIIKKLINDELDAGLLVTPLSDERLIERHLFYEPFYIYVSTNHALSKKKIISEQDLDRNDLWLLEEGHCFRNQVLKVCSFEKKSNAFQNVEFASGNFETLKNLVRRNSGHTLLPQLAVLDLSQQEIETYIRRLKKPVPTREVSLVHGRSFLKEIIIEAMEDEILLNLPKGLRSLKRKDIEVIDIY